MRMRKHRGRSIVCLRTICNITQAHSMLKFVLCFFILILCETIKFSMQKNTQQSTCLMTLLPSYEATESSCINWRITSCAGPSSWCLILNIITIVCPYNWWLCKVCTYLMGDAHKLNNIVCWDINTNSLDFKCKWVIISPYMWYTLIKFIDHVWIIHTLLLTDRISSLTLIMDDRPLPSQMKLPKFSVTISRSTNFNLLSSLTSLLGYPSLPRFLPMQKSESSQFGTGRGASIHQRNRS